MSETMTIPEVDLSVSALVQAAIDSCGVSDFGDESFREPFERLVEALNSEAKLNAVGRYTWHTRILNSLRARLLTEAWIARHPEILEETIVAPAVIVGLPRTGTTMLHRIMSSDTRFHAPLWYEVRNPAPELDYQFGQADPRIASAEAEVAAMLEANPELAAIHPMDPVGADEEILLLEHSFYSYVPNAFCDVPSYGRWLATHDNRPGYEYLKRLLQSLQWQKKQRGEQAERWLLKAPHHLHFMQTLLDVFPDAQVIQTHRDPLQTVPSICSFHYNLWIMSSDEADAVRCGEQWADMFARAMNHTLETRHAQPAAFCDVWYKDTVTKPFEAIAAVYQFLGMPFTDEARSAMEAWQQENRREDRPPHEYTLEQFGFTESGLAGQYGAYRERFILSQSGN